MHFEYAKSCHIHFTYPQNTTNMSFIFHFFPNRGGGTPPPNLPPRSLRLRDTGRRPVYINPAPILIILNPPLTGGTHIYVQYIGMCRGN